MRRGPEVEVHVRRATEREGRRARRRRARELASNIPKHIDGMSSDDEVTEQQNLIFKQAKGNNQLYISIFSYNFIFTFLIYNFMIIIFLFYYR